MENGVGGILSIFKMIISTFITQYSSIPTMCKQMSITPLLGETKAGPSGPESLHGHVVNDCYLDLILFSISPALVAAGVNGYCLTTFFKNDLAFAESSSAR